MEDISKLIQEAEKSVQEQKTEREQSFKDIISATAPVGKPKKSDTGVGDWSDWNIEKMHARREKTSGVSLTNIALIVFLVIGVALFFHFYLNSTSAPVEVRSGKIISNVVTKTSKRETRVNGGGRSPGVVAPGAAPGYNPGSSGSSNRVRPGTSVYAPTGGRKGKTGSGGGRIKKGVSYHKGVPSATRPQNSLSPEEVRKRRIQRTRRRKKQEKSGSVAVSASKSGDSKKKSSGGGSAPSGVYINRGWRPGFEKRKIR